MCEVYLILGMNKNNKPEHESQQRSDPGTARMAGDDQLVLGEVWISLDICDHTLD
jgi:hypothetical protein